MKDDEYDGPIEIAITGNLGEEDDDSLDKLLDVLPGDECILYFDSPGGAAYSAVSLLSVIVLRGIRATGIVTGECSSAALWPFAACRRRLVTAHSVLMFHPMKWQSEEHVHMSEAAERARHFSNLETDMDELLAKHLGVAPERLRSWTHPGRYFSGAELANEGVVELIDLAPLDIFDTPKQKRKRR